MTVLGPSWQRDTEGLELVALSDSGILFQPQGCSVKADQTLLCMSEFQECPTPSPLALGISEAKQSCQLCPSQTVREELDAAKG